MNEVSRLRARFGAPASRVARPLSAAALLCGTILGAAAPARADVVFNGDQFINFNNSGTGHVYVGDGTYGHLTLGGSAVVNYDGDAYVGRNPADDSTPEADGLVDMSAGSQWTIGGNLYLGGNNGNGTVSIGNGAALSVGGGAGTIFMDGTSVLNLGAGAGTGTVSASTIDFLSTGGTVSFNHNHADYQFGTSFTGDGTINQLAGTTRLTGTSSGFTGQINIQGGTLLANGAVGSADVLVTGGTLGGTGSIGGAVAVQDGGTLAPGGTGVGTLTLGSLSLSSGSFLEFQLGAPGSVGGGVSDLLEISGDLTLDGTVNISDAGSFGGGLYRLMNYGGTLTDEGLEIGTIPDGFVTGDLSIEASGGQVNLLNSAGLTLSFWDGDGADSFENGAVDGGDGLWTATSPNWTNSGGTDNGALEIPPGLAVFSGTAGTITVDDSAGPLSVNAMQFFVSGYRIEGDSIALANPTTTIRVGDGTVDSATHVATIASALTGAAALDKTDYGLLILTGSNSYSGTTSVSAGALELQGGAAILDTGAVTLADAAGVALLITDSERIGSLAGGGTNGGTLGIGSGATLTTGNASNTTFSGIISGSGGLTKEGTGTFTLGAVNSYSGATTINAGVLTAGVAGAFSANSAFTVDALADLGGFSQTIASLAGSGTVRNSSGSARLTVNGSASTTFSGSLINNGGTFALTKSGSGTLTLTGTNSYSGSTLVTGGELRVDGQLTNSAVNVTGATLSGTGSIDQLTTINTGVLAPGGAGSIGEMTFGSLRFNAGGSLNMDLGAPGDPGASDLVIVTGDLQLNGTLNITDAGDFGAGVYRLIDYGGGLTDDVMVIGTTGGANASDLSIQTVVDGQVNLINTNGLTLNFWDGGDFANWNNDAIDGGSGQWTSSTANWTDSSGSVNGTMKPVPGFAVFQGTAGTVNVFGDYDMFFNFTPIQIAGMQFAVDGYLITGDALWFTGAETIFRVGDGTAAGADYDATISLNLVGSGTLVKTDLGTLILSGNNSHSGGTVLRDGALRLENNSALGSGGLTAEGGTLDYGSGRMIANAITLAADLTVDQTGGTATQSGVVSGTFGLTKTGNGTLTLSATNTYTGDTTISAGTLAASGGSAISDAGLVSIASGATFALSSSETIGALSGAGQVTLAANSLILAGAADTTFSGSIEGSGGLTRSGSGTLTLTGHSSYSGATSISGGSLMVDGSIASDTSVSAGARLGGSGNIAAAVTVQADGVLAGSQGSTLTLDSLNLDADAIVEVSLGAADGSAALFDVTGDLGLAGTLDVVDAGSFGAGVYRLFDYGGTLSGTGLAIGGTPDGVTATDLLIQTSIANQVNLISTAGADLLFWDGGNEALHHNGVVNGGAGTWIADERLFTTTDGAVNGFMQPHPGFVVFQGASGAITVDDSAGAISVTGMQFAVDGYGIGGDAIALADGDGTSTIRVGDGSAAGVSTTAEIASELTGSNGLEKTDLGTLLLTGANSYTGGTTISAGTLRIGGMGSIAGDVVNNAALVFDRSSSTTFAGDISGSGSLTQVGMGTFVLTGAATHTGGTVIAASSTIQVGSGGTSGSLDGNIIVDGTLVFDRADALTYAGEISGSGTVQQVGGTSTLTLTGDSGGFGGSIEMDAGTLRVDGTLGSAASDLTVASGSALRGTGSIDGEVTVFGTLRGNQGDTLSFGSLTLSSDALIEVALGEASGSAALFDVAGNLVLDGTLDILDAGQFGAGVYRLFDYGGTLQDDGLAFGDTPVGVTADDLIIQTSIDGRVNLISKVGAELLFWDGGDSALYDNAAVDGGDGTWSADALIFTTADGAFNGTMTPEPGFVVFQGAAGDVTVDDGAGAISVTGIQFAADGYLVGGDSITLANATETATIRVGDGSAAGAAFTATIASELTGSDALLKSDLGTLILTGVNSYSGGTTVAAGTLQIGDGGESGSIAGNVVTYATLTFNRSDDVTFAGNIAGTGSLAQLGGGTLILTGSASHAGGTTVAAGTLQIGDGGTSGSISGDIVTNSSLVFNRSDPVTFAGAISGTGSLTQAGADTLILTGASNHGGGTIVSAGTLQIGAGGTTGSLAGDVDVTGALVFNRSDALTFAGVLTGTGGIVQLGGILELTGDSADFAGNAAVDAGTLAVEGTFGASSSSLAIATGATLTGGGTVGGAVSLADGATLGGSQGATLELGSLFLSNESVVAAALGTPDGSDALFDVAGNLVLDGTLNVSDVGGFGAGIYRLFDYGGSLTDNGLAIGSVPTGFAAGDLSVLTSVAGQISLLNSNDQELLFWDGGDDSNWYNGAIDGGTGIWSADAGSWTDGNGLASGAMRPVPGFAVFAGTAGLVTVEGSPEDIAVTGMQFAVDGYRIEGDAIALASNEAIIRVGDGTAAGSAYVATIASELTGSAKLVKTDLGTLVLTGANSYSGDTEVKAGTLIGNSDSIRGALVNDALVVFDQDEDGSFAGAISGTGTTVKQGDGTLTLAGASSIGWTVAGGGLVSTSALFTGDLEIESGASFTFDQDVDGSYAGILSGAGQLLFSGSGFVALTGDSSGLTGTTYVNNGTLSVNGMLGGSVEVGANGRLEGTGTIGSALIAGTIAPGNSIGTLTVDGDLIFATSAVYEVELDADGRSDRVQATGEAVIEGGSVVSIASGSSFAPLTDYQIVTADGGISGTFDEVSSNLAFLDPSLLYGTNAVTLRMVRNDISFTAMADTANQKATAAAMETLGLGNHLYDMIMVLDGAGARTAFDALSGEGHATLGTSLLEDSRFVRDALLARRPAAEGLVSWGSLFGSWADAESGINAGGFDRSIEGFMTGVETGAGNWRLGAGFGYQDSELRTDRSFAAHVESYHVGANAAAIYGALSVKLGAAYGWHEIESDRDIAFQGMSEIAESRYDSQSLQLFGELGWRLRTEASHVEPFARLAHVSLSGGNFRETGGDAALSGGTKDLDASFASLGIHARTDVRLGALPLSLQGSAAVRFAIDGNDPQVDMAVPGSGPFMIAGTPIQKTALDLELGVDARLSERVRLGASYRGVHGDRISDSGAQATLTWRW